MRSVVSVVTITTLIFLLTGCGGNPQVKENNDQMNSVKEGTSQEAYIDNETSNKNENKTNKDTEYIEKNDGEKTDAEVIAKSNNDVTSKEKEEILNEIDQMLDDVFDSINQMDELDDDDLILED